MKVEKSPLAPLNKRGMHWFLVVVALLLVGLASVGAAQEVTLENRVFNIAKELRCPTCVASSVADSNAPISIEMRNIIQEKLSAGESESDILAYFQGTHGDWILMNPPRRGVYLLVWGLPVLAGVAALGGLALFMRRWTRTASAPVEDVSGDELERVRTLMGGESR